MSEVDHSSSSKLYYTVLHHSAWAEIEQEWPEGAEDYLPGYVSVVGRTTTEHLPSVLRNRLEVTEAEKPQLEVVLGRMLIEDGDDRRHVASMGESSMVVSLTRQGTVRGIGDPTERVFAGREIVANYTLNSHEVNTDPNAAPYITIELDMRDDTEAMEVMSSVFLDGRLMDRILETAVIDPETNEPDYDTTLNMPTTKEELIKISGDDEAWQQYGIDNGFIALNTELNPVTTEEILALVALIGTVELEVPSKF